MSNKIIRHRNTPHFLSPFDGGTGDLWSDFWGISPFFSKETSLCQFSPAMDIIEKENEFIAKLELPGFDPKDIQVEVEDHSLIMSGKRECSNENIKGNYLRNECSSSSFYQKIAFPSFADLENVKCSSKNGVLHITIPKQEKNKRKTVKVELLK